MCKRSEAAEFQRGLRVHIVGGSGNCRDYRFDAKIKSYRLICGGD